MGSHGSSHSRVPGINAITAIPKKERAVYVLLMESCPHTYHVEESLSRICVERSHLSTWVCTFLHGQKFLEGAFHCASRERERASLFILNPSLPSWH